MVKIITDSGSDITQNEAKELGIKVIPIVVIFDKDEYLDGVTMSNDEFYHRLSVNHEYSKTTQVNPATYQKAFEEELEKGNEVLCITLGSKLSGCYQSAIIARNILKDDRIHVVDSMAASVGQKNLVYLALECLKKGMDVASVASYLEKKREDIVVIAAVDTLEYLQKGGRISKAVAIIGNILAMKPVIELDDGQLKLAGKARGYKNAHNLLNKTIDKYHGIDFSLPLSVGYSGDNDELLQKYLEASKPIYESKIDHIPVLRIGATIGTHCGAGTVVLGFFRPENRK